MVAGRHSDRPIIRIGGRASAVLPTCAGHQCYKVFVMKTLLGSSV